MDGFFFFFFFFFVPIYFVQFVLLNRPASERYVAQPPERGVMHLRPSVHRGRGVLEWHPG